MTQSLAPSRSSRAVLGAAVAFAALAWATASAQSAPANPNEAAAAERAQQEADKVFKWILIHADKPKAKPPAAPARPAIAAVAAASRPSVHAKDDGITEKVEPVVPAAAPSLAAAAPKAPAPAPATETASKSELRPTVAAAPELRPASAASDAVAMAAPTGAKPAPPPEPEEEDAPLVLVHQVDPDFPPSVVRRLEKGSVQVRFEVLPDGSVSAPEVVKTSNARLNVAATEAVAKWRFKPIKHLQNGIVELAFDIQ